MTETRETLGLQRLPSPEAGQGRLRPLTSSIPGLFERRPRVLGGRPGPDPTPESEVRNQVGKLSTRSLSTRRVSLLRPRTEGRGPSTGPFVRRVGERLLNKVGEC